MMTSLTARPEAHYLRSASKVRLIVVDMRNAYAHASLLIRRGLMSRPLARSLPTFEPRDRSASGSVIVCSFRMVG